MKKWLLGLVVFCSALFFSSITIASPKGLLVEEPLIRVGLWTEQASIAVSADAAFVLRDQTTDKIIQSYKSTDKIFITAKDKQVNINGKPIKSQCFIVELAEENSAKSIELNRKIYRGSLEIIFKPNAGITVVNVLPLEDYLYSIVPSEMPAVWNMEAVKAQAVAARSYALSGLQKHSAEGFDVCATTHCQVYSGRSSEVERSTQAVDDTRGLTMLYNNKPIEAVFHASSGGYTENSEAVWGTYCPYLRSVKDDDENTPYYSWTKDFSPSDIQTKLMAYGYSIGKLQAIELSKLIKDGENSADRTLRGRIKSLRFIGDKGSVTIDGNKVRTLLGLKSTLFDISVIVPVDKKIEVPIGMYYKKQIDVNIPPYEESGLLTDSDNIRRIYWVDNEKISVRGYGWGHGLGMSQWGAKAMADQAASPSATYFKDILRHYYQDIIIKKLY